MTWEPDALQEQLRQYVDDSIFCVGVQASVSHAGVEYDIALGSAGPDQPATSQSIWRLYCAGKPVLAIAVALLVQEGRIDLDRAVADHDVGGQCGHGRYTPRQLLDHTAGLHGVHGYGFGAFPAAARHQEVMRLRPPAGWDPNRDTAYGEYAPWHVLGELVEAVTGQPVQSILRHDVCEPLADGQMWFAMSDQQYHELYPRLAVGYDLRGPYAVPLLANRNRRPCTEVNVAYGGYGTAQGLQRFYRSLLDILGGSGTAGPDRQILQQFVRPHRRRRYDQSLHRWCNFGLGVMVELADHGFESYVSPSAFGHTGYYGSSLAFADPDADLAAAVVFNGIVDGDMGVLTRRNATLRALYEDIGLRVDAAHRVRHHVDDGGGGRRVSRAYGRLAPARGVSMGGE